jgi:hypothetical protein
MPHSMRSLVVLAFLAACGKAGSPANQETGRSEKPAGPAPAAALAPSAPADPLQGDPARGKCEVTVDGDLHMTGISGGGQVAVGGDYFMTPAEIDKATAQIAEMNTKDKAKLPEAIAAAKTRDPRIVLFLINCFSEKMHASLNPERSKYADVPFKPGKYVISREAMKKPGMFNAYFSTGDDHYYLSGEGSLELTRFDRTGAAGTFEFPAEHRDRQTDKVTKVTVKGKFDFDCPYDNDFCRGK